MIFLARKGKTNHLKGLLKMEWQKDYALLKDETLLLMMITSILLIQRLMMSKIKLNCQMMTVMIIVMIQISVL